MLTFPTFDRIDGRPGGSADADAASRRKSKR
jgi:hypothetical protein